MRTILLLATVALATSACDFIEPFFELRDDLIDGFVVATVQCPDSLALATNETGQVLAFSAEGALLAYDGQPVGKFGSTDPARVSVEQGTGKVRAESEPGISTITAFGAEGSSATCDIEAY